VLDVNADLILLPATRAVRLSGGVIDIVLAGSDDPAYNPSGWTYEVELLLDGIETTFFMEAPVGATVDLTDAIPVAESNGVAITRGEQGEDGPAGLSAYQLAVQDGFVGTLTEWLASLKGAQGDGGTNTPTPGADGLSAYQLAVQAGFSGDLNAWLASLHGADGQDGTDGQDGSDGADGKSAYQLAQDAGFVGTQAAWLASLKGADGQDGTDGQDGQDGADADTSTLLAKVGNGTVDLGVAEQVARFRRLGDGSDQGTWLNQLEFAWRTAGGVEKMTSYFNEFGELRVLPAQNTSVAFRVFTKAGANDTDHTGNLIELQDDRETRTVLFSVDPTGKVTAPNIGAKVITLEATDSVPAGTPAGTVVVKKRS